MTKEELDIHLNHTRKIINDLRDLRERIDSDKSDDAFNIRVSYERITKEAKFLLSRNYDVEN